MRTYHLGMENLTPGLPLEESLFMTEFGARTLEDRDRMQRLQRTVLRAEAEMVEAEKRHPSRYGWGWSAEMELRNERCIAEHGFSTGLR